MNYTIADMIRDNLIPGIRQLTYGQDLGAAEIETVTVQEYPADDFVQPGDLVLSTAEGCTADEGLFAAFLDELSQSGACGVLFAFRDPDYVFPDRLRAQAQKIGLPVFRIPWKLRFAQIQSDLIRCIHRRNIEYLTEYKLKNDFVWNLATGEYESFPQMAMQGKRLKFDLSLPYDCIRMKVLPRENLEEYSGRAAQTAASIESAIERAARLSGLHILYAARSMEFLLYTERRPGRDGDVNTFLALLQEGTKDLSGDIDVAWGICPGSDGQTDFSKLASQAAIALEYACRSPEKQYTYRDAEEAILISALLRDEASVAIAENTLAPLLEDDLKGEVFLQTLSAYFRSCGNATRAAAELNIHRVSLMQRLEKIEVLTGRSLKNPRDRLLLQLCVRMALDEM